MCQKKVAKSDMVKMGKQLNFFMLRTDEHEFLSFVKSTGNVVIYPYRAKKRPFKPLKELAKPFSVPYWMNVYLHNKAIGTIVYRYIEKQKSYYLDSDKSTVIEFSRCGLNKRNELLEGRIWIATAHVEKDFSGKLMWIQKPNEFTKWYEKIARWLRKNFVKVGITYISKRVIRWLSLDTEQKKLIGTTLTFAELERIRKMAKELKK